MGLITKKVVVKWVRSNKKYYEELGYIFTKYGDEFEVVIEDLPKGSHIRIECKCDNCGEKLTLTYKDYNKRKRDNCIYCQKCTRILFSIKNNIYNRINIEGRKTFYDWCMENNRQDVLDRWDYELNDCSPKDVLFKSNKKYWFKCLLHIEHESELKSISGFTSGEEGVMDCKQCNSFAQWCIDNDRQDLLNRWDYDLNNCSPWEVSYGSHKKIWFKCNKYEEHRSKQTVLNSITSIGRSATIKCNQCNSIAQWFIDNNLDIKDYWDYDKNTIDPWEIFKGSNQKIWIKCQEKDYHGSYETTCYNIVSGYGCPYCKGFRVHPKDSLGQYIIDNYGEEFLWKIWSDKNKKSPFDYRPKSSQKVWWKCLEGKHEDYQRTCANAVAEEFRCYNCSKEKEESIYEEKTRLYLEELGYVVKTEHNCSIRPVNPKTKQPLPFDNEIVLANGKHLIIEVHGGQHYNCGFYKTINKCSNKEAQQLLYKRRLYDRYKRIKCIQAGYEYLELSYTSFNRKEDYKLLIDNKIKDILKK